MLGAGPLRDGLETCGAPDGADHERAGAPPTELRPRLDGAAIGAERLNWVGGEKDRLVTVETSFRIGTLRSHERDGTE